MKSIMNTIKKLNKLLKHNQPLFIKIIIFVIILFLIIYIYNINHKTREALFNISNPDTNCDTLKKIYSRQPSLTSSVKGPNKNNALRDFYVKTAYNCCCGGQYKNDYVNLCALTTCIQQGVRCLDFEIFSINNEPVVAASTGSNYNVKETYNSLKLIDVFNILKNTAFSGTVPIWDPLILHFRIKSDNIPMYNEFAALIKNKLKNLILGTEYSYEYNGKNLGAVPISKLERKIIIIVDANTSKTYEKTKLAEYVNIASGNSFMRSLKYSELIHNDDPNLRTFNKTGMSIVLPTGNLSNENPKFNIAREDGCQFLGMSFQNLDSNLEHYNDFFRKNKSAFVLKPEKLRKN
jgi:hypothetical protein